MFPWSVIPRAVWPSVTAASTRSPTRAAPSSIENSEWTWRWVKPPVTGLARRAGSQVGPGAHVRARLTARLRARFQFSSTHTGELLLGSHLLGEQGGLDALNETFEPPH